MNQVPLQPSESSSNLDTESLANRLRLALDVAGLGTWDWEIGTNRLIWDLREQAIFGFSPGEFDGSLQNFLDRVHPEDRPAVDHVLTVAAESGAPFDGIFRIILPSGEVRHLRGLGQVYRDAAGRPSRMIGVNTDVTSSVVAEDRHRELTTRLETQNARLEQESRLAGLRAEIALALVQDAPLTTMLTACCESLHTQINAALVRVWTLDRMGATLELQASAGLYTHTDGAHSRIPLGQFKIGTIAATGVPHLTNQVIGDPLVHDQEWAIREKLVAFAGHPLIIEGQVVGVLAVFSQTALSDQQADAVRLAADTVALGIGRKRATDAAREGQSREQAIVASSMDCIITIDQDGRVLEFNPAAEATFGYSRDEVLGKDLANLIIPSIHREQHRHGMTRLHETGRSRVLRQRLTGLPALRKDGSTFPTELTIVPMDFAGKQVYTAFLRDVTEQTEAERRRQEAESAMQRARDEAEDANRSKTHFLANMSHEVRTPMSAIVGYAEILLDPRLSVDERMRTLQAVMRNGRHLLALINDVLDLTKIESGKMELESVPCRLWQAVGEALSVAGVAAQEKGLSVQATVQGWVPRVLTTDPTRLRQILDNLLSNAVKFTASGKHVDVRLRLDRTGSELPKLEVEVEDQGIGMSHEVVAKLFRPFTQADPTTTRRFGGTGLGLSISKRLAEGLGGSLNVISTPGQGSRFILHLPVAEEDLEDLVDQDELTRESQLRAPSPSSSLARKLSGRVLFAEDNPDNQNIIRYFLERTGLTVEVVSDGRAAVERASSREYDLVLMDMQMPELDGYAATSTLRQKGYVGSIVALTAHAMAGDEEKCLRAGCNAYLTKPVEPDRLLRVVQRYLRSRSWTIKTSSLTRTLPPDSGTESRSPIVDSGSLAALVASYRSTLVVKVEELSAAVEHGDSELIIRLAHRLKGSAAMYGFPELSLTAGLIEQAATERQDIELMVELVNDLRAAANTALASGVGQPPGGFV